jgi:hypothetical protein
MIVETFDLEFKLWLQSEGINIDSGLFELKFNAPQNFAAYRQSELDTARVATFASLQEIPHMSKRFAMKRFLGMTQEEITENERMWREENDEAFTVGEQDASAQMRGAGISGADISGDLGAAEGEEPDLGAEGETPAAPAGAAAPPAGNEPFTA